MSFSDYLENKLLDHLLKGTAYTAETNLFVGLFTADPGDSFTAGTEVSGGSYARVTHNTWNAAVAGSATNDGAITFATATGTWGVITHVAILNNLTATASTNILAAAALDTSKTVLNQDTVSFADTALKITLD